MDNSADGRATIRDVYEINQRLEKKFDDFVANLSKTYVTKEEFWPVKAITYGGAGIVMTTALGWLLSLIVHK